MFKLNIREVSYALSEALDFVGIDDLFHGKRVAYMSSEICKYLGYSQSKIDDIINIGMLHDCGVSNTDVHHSLVTELDWDGSNNHCVRGEKLLKSVHLYAQYAEIILYHHTHWNILKNLEIDEEVKRFANIILLTDRVDALRAQGKSNQEIYDVLNSQRDKMFKSEFVSIFLEVAQPESFWFYQDVENLELILHEWISQEPVIEYSFKFIKEIAMMFSNIVDAKSKFTSEHSTNVSKLSIFIAKKMNVPQEKIDILELAALLHDLGKLRVADNILEKKGPLNESERLIMDKHGFDSEMILRKVNAFKDIATLASSHHEKLNGTGYPYQKNADSLSLESRILTICDIFQALIQKRPYRKKLKEEKIFEIMDKMAHNGEIDILVYDVLKQNLNEAYLLAC